MVKEGICGVFGKPKSVGNNVLKASNRLEEDAHAMETRLLQLRVKMQEEKQKREAELPLRHAGNRWRSAREDRGSVSQYARDIQQKTKKQSKKDSSESGRTKSSKVTKKSGVKVAILSPATVEQWTVPQVLEWLTTMELDEFQSGFEFHQVTGKMLLQMTLEGWEKLGVYKVSARNRLLAEMEQIRGLQTKKLHNEIRNNVEAAEIIDSKLKNIEFIPDLASTPSKSVKKHWSHVAPLSETDILRGDGQVPVNLADGEYDEDASHTSFMKALLEWRESDSNQQIESNQDDEWINPILTGNNSQGGALLEGIYDEEEASNSFQQAILAWRNGGNPNCSVALTAVEQIENGCVPSERKSCWQCYRVLQVDSLLHDGQTNKSFCGSTCQEAYHEQYARFYPSSS